MSDADFSGANMQEAVLTKVCWQHVFSCSVHAWEAGQDNRSFMIRRLMEYYHAHHSAQCWVCSWLHTWFE